MYSFQIQGWHFRTAVEPDMRRNTKTLFNFGPPTTEPEIRDTSPQFAGKLSSFKVP